MHSSMHNGGFSDFVLAFQQNHLFANREFEDIWGT